MSEVLYTVPEVAKLLKINQGTVHNLRKAGLLRFMKLGKYKVRAAEIDRFLKEYEGKDITDPYNVIDLDSERTDEEESNGETLEVK